MMPAAYTIAARSQRVGYANGFDGLRLLLALGVFVFHCHTLTTAGSELFWPIEAAARLILPAFFVLSGYLVMSSLDRCGTVREFLLLRLVRILPALTLITLTSVFLIGPLFTTLDLHNYFTHPAVPAYLRNILVWPHFSLPGLFEDNPRAGIVNGSLWSIQVETFCYGLLGVAALLSRGRMLNLFLVGWGVLLLFPRIPFLGLVLAWLPAKDLALSFVAGALLRRYSGRVVLYPAAGLASLLLAFSMFHTGADAALSVLPLSYGVIWLAVRKIPASLTRADYSYGLYLASYPIQQAVIFLFPGIAWWGVLTAVLPLALLYAAFSWHAVERRLLARRHEIVSRLIGTTAPVRA